MSFFPTSNYKGSLKLSKCKLSASHRPIVFNALFIYFSLLHIIYAQSALLLFLYVIFYNPIDNYFFHLWILISNFNFNMVQTFLKNFNRNLKTKKNVNGVMKKRKLRKCYIHRDTKLYK